MKQIIKNTIILTMITLVSGLLLGTVFEITKAPIAEQALKTKKEAFNTVFKDAAEFSEEIEEADIDQTIITEAGYTNQSVVGIATALDSASEELGYVITVVSHEGYGGDIKLSVGIQKDGTVNGIAILSINETAGLGMKAKELEFRDLFSGKMVETFVYTKAEPVSDSEIKAISGATITTNAVVNGVNAALTMFRSLEGGEVQ